MALLSSHFYDTEGKKHLLQLIELEKQWDEISQRGKASAVSLLNCFIEKDYIEGPNWGVFADNHALKTGMEAKLSYKQRENERALMESVDEMTLLRDNLHQTIQRLEASRDAFINNYLAKMAMKKNKSVRDDKETRFMKDVRFYNSYIGHFKELLSLYTNDLCMKALIMDNFQYNTSTSTSTSNTNTANNTNYSDVNDNNNSGGDGDGLSTALTNNKKKTTTDTLMLYLTAWTLEPYKDNKDRDFLHRLIESELEFLTARKKAEEEEAAAEAAVTADGDHHHHHQLKRSSLKQLTGGAAPVVPSTITTSKGFVPPFTPNMKY